MKILIKPRLLSGGVTPPPSKSMAHRMLICAALADGRSAIENIDFSDDVKATLRCLECIGAGWKPAAGGGVEITGTAGRGADGTRTFDCGESGSTLRFFIPIALALYGRGRFAGTGRLMKRPQGPYLDLFMEKGINFSYTGDTIEVSGGLKHGAYSLRGDVSSQFFSGLLFALPLLGGGSVLASTTRLESLPYVEMTRSAQARAGIRTDGADGSYSIRGGQCYAPFSASVEADWSQATFWLMANLLGSDIELQGMDAESAQGDRAHGLAIAEAIGDKDVKEVEIDISDCPDLLPPAAAAAAARGKGFVTRFSGAARLRMKESDRLASVASVINALGGRAEEEPDGITIYGEDGLRGGVEISCYGDHRIAMMAAIAAVRCGEEIVLDGAECVNKSYPGFWKDYKRLGGYIEELGQ